MTAAQATPGRPTKLLMLGRIPPPVTGMTVFTQEVLNRLRSLGEVEFVNWSVGSIRRTAVTRLRYVGRSLSSVVRMLLRGRARGQRMYLVANSEAGLYSTAVLTYVAGSLGYSIYLHHHVYSYINQYDRRMACIDRWMGPRGVHVVHCEKMAQDFSNRYSSRCKFAVVCPSAVSIELRAARITPRQPLQLGMLSNLTMSKGVGRAIEVFRRLRGAGRNVALTFAGPAHEEQSSRLIAQARVEFPGLLTHVGPLYGEDKTRFFSDMDVFLFPTEYEHESWGIVLNEALATGIPVITNDRGCSRIVVGGRAGLVVEHPSDYVDSAVRQIEHWLDAPAEYAAASVAAIEQADFLNREGQRTLSEFAAHMFSPLDSADGLLNPS